MGITSISSWKSVIWRGIISCFWREGDRERKRERDRESWTEEPELDKFSIRSLIGRLFHPTQRERIQRRRTCTRPSLSLSLSLSLSPSLSFYRHRSADILAHIPRLSMYSRVIDRVRLSFFCLFDFSARAFVRSLALLRGPSNDAPPQIIFQISQRASHLSSSSSLPPFVSAWKFFHSLPASFLVPRTRKKDFISLFSISPFLMEECYGCNNSRSFEVR